MPSIRAVGATAVVMLAALGCGGGSGSDGGDAGGGRAAAGSVGSSVTPLLGFQVVRSYPHDPGAYTQGLVYLDGVLYEGTGLAGRSALRRATLASGAVEDSVQLAPEYFGEGVAVLGDTIYQLTWKSGTAFAYDRGTLERRRTFTYAGEGWGLAAAGRSLIMSDGTNRLRFLDPATFQVRRTLEVKDAGKPVTQLNELELIDGHLFANVWQSDSIAKIDTTTGEVRGWLDLSSLRSPTDRRAEDNVLNGIAYDSAGGRVFVTGKQWARLYELRLAP